MTVSEEIQTSVPKDDVSIKKAKEVLQSMPEIGPIITKVTPRITKYQSFALLSYISSLQCKTKVNTRALPPLFSGICTLPGNIRQMHYDKLNQKSQCISRNLFYQKPFFFHIYNCSKPYSSSNLLQTCTPHNLSRASVSRTIMDVTF